MADGSFAGAVARSLAVCGCPAEVPGVLTSPRAPHPGAGLAEEYWHWFGDPAGPRIHLIESVYTQWTRLAGPGLPFANERGWMGGDSAVHMADLYSSLGLTVPEEWAHAPDHLALEMEFLALLAEHGTPGQQEQFLRQHLGWLPHLVSRAEAAGVDGFYRALLTLVAQVVDRLLVEAAGIEPLGKPFLPPSP